MAKIGFIRHNKNSSFVSIFARMKTLALIFFLLLTLLSGGGKSGVRCDCPQAQDSAVLEQQSSERVVNQSFNTDICLSSALGYTFNGENSTGSSSVRTTNAGRRIQSQAKSSLRSVKSGKVIDYSIFNPLLSSIPLSGTRTSERFIYSICTLRI